MAASEIQPGDSVSIYWPIKKKKNDENHDPGFDQVEIYHGTLLSLNAERTFARIRFDEEGGGKKTTVSLKYVSKLEEVITEYGSDSTVRSETPDLSLQLSQSKSTPRSEQPKKKKRRLSTNLDKHAQTVASSVATDDMDVLFGMARKETIIPHFHVDQVSDFHVLGYIEIQVPSTPRERYIKIQVPSTPREQSSCIPRH